MSEFVETFFQKNQSFNYNNYLMTDAGEQFSELQSLIDWRNFFSRSDPDDHQLIPAVQRIEQVNNPIINLSLPVQSQVLPVQPVQQLPINNISIPQNPVHNPFGLSLRQIEEMDYIITMAFQQTICTKKNKQVRKKKLQTKKVEVTSQCPICLEDIRKNSRVPHLDCKHQFHQKCLNSWMKKKQSCPLCRLNIGNNQD